MNANTSSKLLDLYSKSPDYKFNQEEIEFIKKHTNKNHYEVRYAFYKPISYKGLYIVFIIDSNRGSVRKSGVEVKWDVICKRDISPVEYQEIIENFGCNTRRFKVWFYKDIQTLIQDDAKYNIKTPEQFVNLCLSKGYSKEIPYCTQLKLNF